MTGRKTNSPKSDNELKLTLLAGPWLQRDVDRRVLRHQPPCLWQMELWRHQATSWRHWSRLRTRVARRRVCREMRDIRRTCCGHLLLAREAIVEWQVSDAGRPKDIKNRFYYSKRIFKSCTNFEFWGWICLSKIIFRYLRGRTRLVNRFLQGNISGCVKFWKVSKNLCYVTICYAWENDKKMQKKTENKPNSKRNVCFELWERRSFVAGAWRDHSGGVSWVVDWEWAT